MAADSFQDYIITTRNPGPILLCSTFGVCLLCFVIAAILCIMEGSPLNRLIHKILKATLGQQDENNDVEVSMQNTVTGYHLQQQQDDDDENGLFTTRKNTFRGKKRYGGVKSKNSLRKLVTKIQVGPRTNETKNAKVKITMKIPKQRVGRFEENLNFDDLMSFWSESNVLLGKRNTSHDDENIADDDKSTIFVSSKNDKSNKDGLLDEDKRDENETSKVFSLASPWIAQSIVTSLYDIIYLIILSQFLGVNEMVCYSIGWFIISTIHIVTEAWHSSVYKHLVAAVAQETKDGATLAGRYLQIATIGKLVLWMPLTIVITYFMPFIMNSIGYSREIVDISRDFAIGASIIQLINSCCATFSSLLEIEGHAKFNAIFDFWECLIGFILTYIFALLFRPSLLAMTAFNCFIDLTTVLYYMYLTYEKHTMFKSYVKGFIAPVELKVSTPVKSMINSAIPYACLSATEYLKGVMFAVFAAYQGAAEAATWILLWKVWCLIEIVPECIASAATVRVEHNLSRGDLTIAKMVARRSLVVCTISSIFFSTLLMVTRQVFAWSLSLDETLQQMIIEVIPYIALCQPFITAGVSADYLNGTLGRYSTSVGISTLIDVCFTIPLAAMFTYIVGFNLEGLASAMCIGYAVTSVTNLVIFSETDWQYAAKKVQEYTEE